MTFKAAAVQMCSGVDPARNAASMMHLVREAAAQGAIYVQTPEMTGMLQRDKISAKAVLRDETDDIIVRTASALAAELGIYLHVGSTAIALDDGKIANRGFLFGPDGKILNRYDKIHMFDVDLDHVAGGKVLPIVRVRRRASCRCPSRKWALRYATMSGFLRFSAPRRLQGRKS